MKLHVSRFTGDGFHAYRPIPGPYGQAVTIISSHVSVTATNPGSANNKNKVDHLGTLMPLLSELRLERGSTLASFRDLGSSLSNLRVVWLSACGIRHLDGVGALSGLEELYLAFNDVEDLTSIALHERLEVQYVKFAVFFRDTCIRIRSYGPSACTADNL